MGKMDGNMNGNMNGNMSVELNGNGAVGAGQKENEMLGENRPPKAKKRVSPPAVSAAPQQAFHFVDGTSSSKEKRAHVMRHHLKEKGKLRQRGGHVAKVGRRSGPYLPWTKKPASIHEDQKPTVFKADGTIISSASDGEVDEQASATQNRLNRSVSLDASNGSLTRMSASRKDPFDSLPLALRNDEHELVAFWTSRLAYWSGENTSMKDIVFRRAMQNPVTFQVVILTYCARYRDHVYGLVSSPESCHHIAQAKRALDEYIKTANDPEDDNVVMAMAALSLQEERYGNSKKAAQDIEGARQMLRPRIGRNNAAETFLHYVYYLTGPPDRPKDLGVVYPLMDFLRFAERLMVDHSSSAFLSQTPERKSLFEIGSPLHELLSSGPHPTRVSPENHKFVLKHRIIPETCRTAALLYITMGLYDCHGSPDKCRRFLHHITTIITERGLDRVPAVESFAWFLIEERWGVGDTDLRNPIRPTAVGDALKNLKILGTELQFHYTEVLLGYLMFNPPKLSQSMFEKGLEKDIPGSRDIIHGVP